MWIKPFISLFVFISVFALNSFAKIKIDPEAISKDSVYPKFKNTSVVKNRKIKLENKMQISGLLGTIRNNPFYESTGASLLGTYFFSEENAVEVMFSFLSSKPSKHSEALEAQTNVKNLSLAPEPKYLLGLSYKILPYYGKISLSKSLVFSLKMYGVIGGGMFNIGGGNFPYLNVGIGQALFLNKRWGLNFDLRGLLYNGPDAISIDLTGETSAVDPARFDKILSFNLLMNLGVFYTF